MSYHIFEIKAFGSSIGCMGGIAQAYKEIREFDQADCDDLQIRKHQEAVLRNLLERACNETRHYSDFKGKQFDKFPVINKNTIREDQDAFISSRYSKDDLIQMSTSGSTGTPFICYQNVGKKKRVNAEIIYYSEKVGYKLGDNLSYIRTIVKQNKKSRLKQFMQNQSLINCMTLDDRGVEQMIDEIRKMSKYGTVTLLAYGSTYTAIKDYSVRNNIRRAEGVRICGAISGSDMLFDETREKVSAVFGDIPVVSRYSNEENGVLGQDEEISNVFPINEADYIIEIFDDNGNPVQDGTLGHIVVTDLYNYAMPMIRYDTGDVGAIKAFEIKGRKKRCICDFSGRSVDVIHDTSGAALSPFVITNYMWSFTDINQFQVIQNSSREYTIKLNVSDSFSREEELKNLLHQLLGADAEISIVHVNEIPVLASGKRRYIINQMEA